MIDDRVSRYVWNRWNVYISNLFALFVLHVVTILKQNRDLFYFWFCSRNTLWKDFSCFRRLIWSLSWKSNDRGGLKFWTCLHATVLLSVKYSAELNKYILLVRVICEKYRLRGEASLPRCLGGEGNVSCPRNRYIIPPYIWMLSSDWLMQGVFFTNP